MERAQEATVGTTRIVVVEGDITGLAVDAIVNAANRRLQHGGGVAAAIARAAGPDLQRDSDAWVREHGPLADDGDAAVTPAGDLPAEVVVHVAGPVFSPDSDRNEAHLGAAVRGALDAVAERGLRSVALPAISAGIYGYPPDEATAVIAAVAVRWAEDHPTRLDAILLVGYDRAMASRFQLALERAIG